MIKSLPSSLACHFLGALSGAAFPPDHSKASFQCKPHLPEHFLGPRTASRPRPSQNISEPHPELSQNVIPTARTFPKAARGKPRTHTPEPLRNGPIPTPLLACQAAANSSVALARGDGTKVGGSMWPCCTMEEHKLYPSFELPFSPFILHRKVSKTGAPCIHRIPTVPFPLSAKNMITKYRKIIHTSYFANFYVSI